MTLNPEGSLFRFFDAQRDALLTGERPHVGQLATDVGRPGLYEDDVARILIEECLAHRRDALYR